MNTNSINKINSNNNELEVAIGHLGLHGQMIFKGCKEIANQNQAQVNPKQKSMSKISRMVRKLPNVKKTEYFKCFALLYKSI